MSGDELALAELFRVTRPGALHRVQHYLYLASEEAASEVAAVLRAKGYDIEQRLGADGVNWLVLAGHNIVPTADTIASARELMEDQVSRHRGEYDGWEAEVVSDAH